jgi:hypothetical protein
MNSRTSGSAAGVAAGRVDIFTPGFYHGSSIQRQAPVDGALSMMI